MRSIFDLQASGGVLHDRFDWLITTLDWVSAVIELAQQRLQRNPNHFQALAALAWAYGQTGQTVLQRHTFQEMVTRAAQEPLYAQAPALAEAQAALQGMDLVPA